MVKFKKEIYSLGGLSELMLEKLKPFTKGIATDELAKRLDKVLFGEEIEQHPRTKDPNIRYWYDNFASYLEIMHSFERLYQTYGYIQKYPHFRYYNFYGINEFSWIRYHIEFFLQETYILHQRTVRWIGFLLQRAKHKPHRKAEEVTLIRLRIQINKALARMNRLRGSHVHGYTFEGKGFLRAETAMFLISTLKQKKMKLIKNIALFEITSEWRKTINQNILSLAKSYDSVLSVLGKIMVRLE